MLLPIAILLAISEPACHPVLDGERILGQHLAKADGRYAVLPPDAIVGLAPMPGIRRTVPAFTLRKLLEAQGADLTDIAPVCLEWPMRHLKPAELKLAMAATLAIPDLPIEVLDYTVAQVPAGELVFPRKGISSEEAILTTGVTWRGHVLLPGDRSFQVWARVRIPSTTMRLVAVKDLPVGKPIAPGDLELAAVLALPPSAEELQNPAEAEGLHPRRSIRRGELVRRNELEAPVAVQSKDMLQVELRRGAVRFKTAGRAVIGGRVGEWITVENPETGRRYRARVDGPGRVEIP